MTVQITAYGQTITHEFVNNMFVEQIVLVSVTPTASVDVLNGNQNRLNITVTELYSDGSTIVITESFMIRNNSDGIFNVGAHNVFVSTRGNDQIRNIYIVLENDVE